MPYQLIYHDLTNTATASPFDIAIQQLAHNADVDIACPYLTLDYVRSLVESSHSWRLLTDVQAWIHSQRGAASAIHHFIECNADHIHDRRGLHAKVIIAHDKAFFGSANFTNAGLKQNDELSIVIDHEPMVEDLHQWFNQYWEQTRTPDIDALTAYIQDLASEPVEERPRTARMLPSTGPVIQARLLPRAPSHHTSTEAADPRPRVCSKCGRSELETPFYKNRKITFCKEDFNKVNLEARRKTPERKKKVREYNDQWFRDHPGVAKRAAKNYLKKKQLEKKAYRERLYADGWRTITQAGEMLGMTRQGASLLFLNGKFGEAMIDEHDTRRRYVRASEVERYAAEREKRDV